MQISLLFNTRCHGCGGSLQVGDPAWWERPHKLYFHLEHAPRPVAPPVQKPKNRTVTLSRGGSKFILKFPFDHQVVQAIRQVPNAEYKDYKDSKEWHVPLTGVGGVALAKFIDAWGFECAPGVRDKLTRTIIQSKNNIIASRQLDAKLNLEGFGTKTMQPYGYQRAGIAYAIKNPHCIIGDPPGVGKTIQGLGVLHILKEFPCLVLTISVGKVNWARHILGHPAIGRAPWLPYVDEDEVAILEGLQPEPLPPGLAVVIGNHDIIAPRFQTDQHGDKKQKYPGWKDELKKYGFRMVIVDEIHYYKSPNSARSLACEEICKDVPYVMGLTGTPFPNRPKEIMEPLKIIGMLDKEFGGTFAFGSRYCSGFMEKIGRNKRRFNIEGGSHLDELNERMRATCYRRVEWEDVKKDAPPKRRDPLPMSLANRKEYDFAELELARWLGMRAADDRKFLESIAHLPKARQSDLRAERRNSAEQRARGNEQLLRFMALKKLAAEGKMPEFTEWADNFLESGDKLVVFAWHKDIQDLAYEHFLKSFEKKAIKVVRIHGDDSRKKQQEAIDSFQQDPSVRVVIASIGVASESIDLIAANTCVFLEYSWGPGKQNQAEGRLYRDGQKKPVYCFYTAAMDSIDEELLAIIDGKRVTTTMATSGFNVEDDATINALVGHLLEKHKDALAKEGLAA